MEKITSMEIALNSDTPGGFKHRNAIASQNGLALLASITLKNALNINCNNNSSTIINKKNTTKDKNNFNHLSVNHKNKNNIKHHKAPQPQHVFISPPAMASSSLSSNAAAATISSPSFLSLSSTKNTAASQTLHSEEQNNTFTFTTSGLEALTATTISTIESEIGAVAVDQQQQSIQQVQTLSTAAGLATAAMLSSNNANNHHTSLSTNHHHQTKNTLSAKDPTVALLEALSIKTKKKQNISTQQLQKSSSTTSAAAVTTTPHMAGGAGGNNNTSNNGSGSSNKNSFRIPSDILDDLASRFIINVPDMELSNLIRICFQIELAHWFYLDFFCASEEEKKLQPCGIKQFALQIFEHIPFLRQHLSSIDKILEDWKNYKLSVPTYGAILISEDLNYCLLVQSYFAKSSWGFPKGKVNENEDPVHCATREVYEETGYDITELIVPNDFIEAVINYQYTRLYIVRDVSLETKFSPRTRNEIKCCDWFLIDSLPANKNDAISKPKLGINANSFFMIMPFVKRLKKWVNDKRNGVETQRKYSSGGSPTSTSPLTTSNMANGPNKSNCKKQQKRNNSNNFNDDTNALKNVGGGAPTAVISTFSCGNANCSNSNSNRSKRQRHKSMGDLDGVKLNNFNNCNNQSTNCKSANNNNNNSKNNNNCGSSIATSGTPATNNCNSNCNNMNANVNNNNQKRNSKIVAAGNNVVSNPNNGCNNSNNSNNNININGNTSSKRQLFHSQSQTINLQQNGEKIVSSFDLIRKEKQQMKTALAKAQKQQQNVINNNGRQRAKSQSDKLCMQQQQQKSTGNGSNNNSKQQQQQQRLQKQQSLSANNANIQNYNINSNNSNHQNNINNSSNKNHNNNNINIKSIVNNNINNKMTTGGYHTPTPPPLSGNDLLALAAAAAAATSLAYATTTETSSVSATITPQQVSSKSVVCGYQQQQQQQQQEKPRPSSVSLHFPEAPSIKRESSSDITANQMPQFKRMPSGTNLRILKRSTSHQPTQETQQLPQLPQRQASALQFTPNFNSWTNFTFTKNFIANVFC